MSTVLWTTGVAVGFLALIAGHEAGRALALRSVGIPITEAGLGLPVPPRLLLAPAGDRPFRLSLSPWLICAYVRSDDNALAALRRRSYADQAWCAGAGTAVNVIAGCGLASVISILHADWGRLIVWLAIGVATAVRPLQFAAYVMPVLSIPALGFSVWAVIDTEGRASVGEFLIVSTPSGALLTVCVLSLAVALLDSIPVYPLAGGRIARLLILRWRGDRAAAVFQVATAVVVAGLVAYSLVSDVLWAMRS